jgi:uncharacterized protein YbjT (DUF2867 family)
MRILVTGATGFVGGHLVARLVEQGHETLAMTRRPGSYEGPGDAVVGEIADRRSLRAALDDVDVAYYLVHSLARADFVTRDREGAINFATAATDADVRQVVYLGGLGGDGDDLSPHLRSRRDVERILVEGAPTTALRAGIIIGDGGISWEILRQLVDRLPVMVTPRWVQTPTQPIALDDVLTYLVAVGGRAEAVGHTYEIGGPDVLAYRDMLLTLARITSRRRLVVPVPILSPGLSSWWLRLLTDVDLTTARSLVESMTNEVLVHDRSVQDLVPHRPVDFATAARAALQARARRIAHTDTPTSRSRRP